MLTEVLLVCETHSITEVLLALRFGRISELPGECPMLSGAYATEMVKGMQEGISYPKYIKIASALKHFTCYSTETDRMQMIFNVSQFDLFDSYLPQYKAGFIEGGAMGAMCCCERAFLSTVPVRFHCVYIFI